MAEHGEPVLCFGPEGTCFQQQAGGAESCWGPGIRGDKMSLNLNENKRGLGWAGRGAAGGTENQEESQQPGSGTERMRV